MSISYIQNKNIVMSKIGNEVVMLDIELGTYYGLNSVASTIWEMLESETSIDDLIEKLMKKYHVQKDICEQETLALLKDFLKKGLIIQK